MERLLQPLNAEFPIEVRLFDKVTFCKYEQFSKAFESRCVTVSGIVILVKLEQFLNAEFRIIFK